LTEETTHILVSGCSAGLPVSHDGRDRLSPAVGRLFEQGLAVAVCPEQLGGMGTPRETCEITGGDGEDVLDGKARVITRSGRDVTALFLEGASRTLEVASQNGCRLAILKARSPSCGAGLIYDGTFNGGFKPGFGVAAAMLKRAGLEVITDEEYQQKA
jgi:uncharacterized protein YbbK (DUF523 family)